MRVIERTIEIDAPLPRVFEFITDIRNHSRVVPPATREELLAGGDEALRQGSVVRLSARHLGIRWTMACEITSFVPPGQRAPVQAYFQDRQIIGPFAIWVHEHWFDTVRGGATRLTDRFTYAAPFGPLGRFAESIWLHNSMCTLLEHMQAAQKRLIETEAKTSNAPPDTSRT